jgi:hypothetical protein
MDLKLRGFPPKHRRVWLVGFEVQKVLAWRLLLSRFSVPYCQLNDRASAFVIYYYATAGMSKAVRHS